MESDSQVLQLLRDAGEIPTNQIGGVEWRDLQKKFMDKEFNHQQFIKQLN